MQRVRKDDTVRVISGKDAGREGRVVRVYPKRDRVMVEGVNRVTRHLKQQRTRAGAQQGGIVHEEAPVHLSNVMPVCPSCGEAVRVGARVVAGERQRFCRKCDSEF
jgi:large subunit ribosomal protein L24